MKLVECLEKNSLVENTKGGLYYSSTFDANLNVFCKLNRYTDEEEIVAAFNAALNEDTNLALANLLYTLDIRAGKGERRLFKIMFKSLCCTNAAAANKVLPLIAELGRFDYVLEGLKTPIEDNVIKLIKTQLEKDIDSDTPSLLGKWMPSHRTHKKNNETAVYLMAKLGLKEREYRKLLAGLRNKLDLVEKKLTNKDYSLINFEKVPTKAMLKYKSAFNRTCEEKYLTYLDSVKNGTTTINTEGLFCYEIIRKIYNNKNDETANKLFDLMWENQKDVVDGKDKNILVMADTSGSMTMCGGLPIANSIGLALYTAEHNNGYFHNYFMTFSSRPKLVKIEGKTITDKVFNIKPIVENTDIDAAFELLLKAAKENNISKEEMPEEILIISDMEFDQGVCSKNGTNFNGWVKAFAEVGYTLPKIVFWNVAGNSRGVPACKYDNNCLMISGFSTNLLSSLLNVTEFKPVDAMIEILSPYMAMVDA